jgi:hypothetical protein
MGDCRLGSFVFCHDHRRADPGTFLDWLALDALARRRGMEAGKERFDQTPAGNCYIAAAGSSFPAPLT